MSQRVSHSLLDPWITVPMKRCYPRLPIPRTLPPEAIVGCGHAVAAVGAVGFALSSQYAWAGLLAAAGVAMNHTCDVLDGTHARSTGQCRNGGELLDHFVDPLSFSYWAAGLAFSATAAPSLAMFAPWLGLAGVLVIYATAVLTSIRAKMIGEFTLNRFGPTEFKTLLVLMGLVQGAVVGFGDAGAAPFVAFGVLAVMTAAGVLQLVVSLWSSVREVNAHGAAPADTTEWQLKP